MPCLFTSAIILMLSLPLALVPYYLLPAMSGGETVTPTILSAPSGVLAQLPSDDAWLNIARVLMCAVALGSCNMWLLRGRDCVLKAMEVERGERQKAGKWVGLGLWVVVVFLACVGGWVAEKIELLGVMATLAVGWLLPCESLSYLVDPQLSFSSSPFMFDRLWLLYSRQRIHRAQNIPRKLLHGKLGRTRVQIA
jgi:hypothetical protein